MTLTLVASGTRPWISAWRRSGMLGNMVVPPDITTLPSKSLRTSRSQSFTVFLVSSCRPIISLPSKDGLNISSGQRIIWLCTVTTVPSGISKLLLLASKVLHIRGEVHGAVAQVLLDLLRRFTLSSGGEGDLRFLENLANVVREVAASQVDALDCMWHRVSLVNWHSVGHTISTIHNHTSGTTRGIQREDSLDGDIEAAHVERLEHDLGHALAVVLGVHWRLCEEDTLAVFVGLVLVTDDHAELVVEGVAPHLLHVVPVLHDTVLQRILQKENTALLLRLFANVVVLVCADESSLLLGVADDGGESHLRCVLTGAPGFHHSGAIVDNDSGLLFFVTHAFGVSRPH